MLARVVKTVAKPTNLRKFTQLLASKQANSLPKRFQSQQKSQWNDFASNGRKSSTQSFQSFSFMKENKSTGLYGGLVFLGAASALGALYMNKEDRAYAEEKNENQNAQNNEPEKLQYKYVIVGSGTAGFSALQEILKYDKDAKVLLVGEEPYIPYSRPPLSKELWKSDDPNIAENLKFKDFMGKEAQIWFDSPPEAKDRVDFILGKTAADLDANSKTLYLADGTTIKFDKILIATGGIPRALPGLPAELQELVTTYRTLDDFKALDKVANNSKHIVVIGGGFLGSEIACGLRTRGQKTGLQVTQVFPETGLMGLVFPKFLSDYATDRVRKELGVEIMPGKVVKTWEKTEDGKVNLTLSTGEVLKGVDQVVVSIGIQPDVLLAKAADLEVDANNGGIVANGELAARSDVYVAGDVLSYYDTILGRRRVEHHDHAVISGAVAGRNMTGAREVYRYIPFFWSDLGSMGYEAVGNVDGKLKTVSFFEKQPDGSVPNPPEFKKGVIYYLNKDNQVVGAILWNNFGKVDEARYAILSRKRFENDSDLKNLVSLEDEHH